MRDSGARAHNAARDLVADEIPADSRHARQLARRQLIAEAVMAEGTVRIEDLTERFGISLMTAHRDLDELAGKGILRKTRGVVSSAPTSLIESGEIYRSARQLAEKQAIAEAAATYFSRDRLSSSMTPPRSCSSCRTLPRASR